ncbi:hypothetical protein TRFO_37122 [Tritrichomonas foetus]|uniref:Uncharacterized protein n=1 Tax=Tritrichomonas foetus TaxID=1144522 RepID=A0A1J4JBZ6_9EUKA|nr:hypothetical protein TRFO_37122 [Tritrichomonas foetus]|eukprot:OHS96710.1 hypothetical protein TRFO_37122 [Tritrichomonas foetus]
MEKLYQAAQSGNLNSIKNSLKRNINLDTPNAQNWTLLHFACFGGQSEVVRFLIEKDVNVNSRTNEGVTPLHLASQIGNEFLIAILVEAGAIIDTRDVFSIIQNVYFLYSKCSITLHQYNYDKNLIFVFQFE